MAPVAPAEPRVTSPEPAVSVALRQMSLRGAVQAFENDLIMRALTKTQFNKQRAADLLGLKRTTLIEMMKRKGFDR